MNQKLNVARSKIKRNRNMPELKSPFASKICRGNVDSVDWPLDIRNDTKAIDFKELNITGLGVAFDFLRWCLGM